MKRFVLLLLIVIPFVSLKAAIYYSQGSLDPGQLSSWGDMMSGGTAPASFTNDGDVFIIQNGHIMTTTGIWTFGNTNSTLQISNGGTLQGDHVIQFTGTFQIDDGGTYIHNNTGSVAQTPAGTSIFSGTESFGANSNFEIRNWIDPLVALPNMAPGIVWGNLIVNLQVHLNQPWNWAIGNGLTLTINGNLDIRSTGTPIAQQLRFAGSVVTIQTINVAGNFLISGANSYVAIKKNTFPPLNGIATMQVNGNISIGSTDTLEITGINATAGAGAKLRFKGNLNNAGTITTNGTAVTIDELELNGNANQNITVNTVTGVLSGSALSFIMNNSSGATLLTPVTLPGSLALTDGKITTTAANLLTMVDNGTYSGGSAGSFVNGPMKKIGNDNFSFPVGIGSIYAPIGVTNDLNEAPNDEFTAEYIRGNPQSVHGTIYQAPVNHISYVEYWTLDRNPGSIATKKVSLAVNFTSFCYDLSKSYVSRFDGTKWTYEGSTNVAGPTSPPYVSGTITSTNTISSFIPTPNAFTLSTDLPFSSNPLPITLISFDATKLGNTKSSVNWELAACCSEAAKFEIQRAGADKNFVTIGSVRGNATNTLYNYTDNGLKSGINYYRLKMIDEDGKITYSRTVAIMNDVNGLLLTSLVPTMINNEAALTITSSEERKLDLLIVDMQGRVLQKQNLTVPAGNTSIQLSASRLSAGVYQLVGISAEGKTNVIRFIKQ